MVSDGLLIHSRGLIDDGIQHQVVAMQVLTQRVGAPTDNDASRASASAD